jgi:hypothetical protein
MRRLGCLVVLLAIAVGLFLADQAVTRYAEQRVAARIERTLGSPADVDLEGWPVSLRLLQGSVPTARLTATDVPLEGRAVLNRLDVELTDVKVDISDLRRNSKRLPPADEGTFSAQLSAASVAAMIGIPPNLAELQFREGGIRLRAAGVQVEADVVAERGDVVVRLDGPLARLLGGAEYALDLSGQPGSPSVREVEIRDGVMTVRGTLDDVRR